jgi:hypothetical protein
MVPAAGRVAAIEVVEDLGFAKAIQLSPAEIKCS